MNVRTLKSGSGLSIAELVIAMLFSSIMIVGTLGFSYYSKLDIHKAELYNSSVGIAELLLNDWKAAGGVSNYDPLQSLAGQLEITQTEPGITGLTNLLGSYHVIVNEDVLRVTLSYKEATASEPKTLNVVVDWVERHDAWDTCDPRGFVKLSCYVADF
ncbi:MAG: hypothetical protein WC374_11340 [Phycisphaerae bacterium]